MVLILGKQRVERHVFQHKGHIVKHPSTQKKLERANAAYKDTPETVIEHNVLYATQEEFVVIDEASRGSIQYIATDEATTCHIVIFVQPDLKVYGLGHFDGKKRSDQEESNTNQGITDMLAAMDARCGTSGSDSSYDLYMYGGFADPYGTSAEVSAELAEAISKAPQVITTKAMIIDEANTDIVYGVPYPRWRGAAVKFEPDTSNFTILRVKVTATGKGPIQPCKMARLFTDVGTIQNGYDNDSKLMIMRAFGVTYPVDETDIVQSDEWIRNNMSSSPPQEREDFEKATREGLAFLLKYEDPSTEFFNSQSMYFMLKADGTWEETTAPSTASRKRKMGRD